MKYITVKGLKMAYQEEGEGAPIVFLHGNPTSSYLWRNVVPHLKGLGRCLVPDLIGMGESDRLPESGPNSYRFTEHAGFLEELLQKLEVEKIHVYYIEHLVDVCNEFGNFLANSSISHNSCSNNKTQNSPKPI